MFEIDWDDAVISKGNNYRLKKALEKDHISLAAFGGSITQGSLADSVEKSYSYLVYEWLCERFPDKQFRYFNCGVGGTGSLYGAFRVKRDLAPCDPDIVLIDFSVNDTADSEALETFEGMLRQVLSLLSQPAVIVIGNVFYDRGESAQVLHSMVCRHYRVPMISMETSLYRAVLTGEVDLRSFTSDDLHPNNFGHRMLADAVINYLQDAIDKDKDQPVELAKPLSVETYAYCNECEVTLHGFTHDKTPRQTVQDRFVEGYVASNAGDSIVFEGYGTDIAVMYRQVVSETDMSPEAEVYVDGKPKGTLEGWFDETWGDNMRMTVVARHLTFGRHRVEIRIKETHDNDTKPFYLNMAGFAGKKPDIMLLDPVCTHNVWGGTRIRTDFGYNVDGDDIGECWGVSAHPNGDGTVRNGIYAGEKLSAVYAAHPSLFFAGNTPDFSYTGSCAYYDI